MQRQRAAAIQGCASLQAMQRALAGFARRQGSLWAAGQRAYAAAAADVAIAPSEDSPFLRFASPVPHPTVYGPDILSSLPETDVRTSSSPCCTLKADACMRQISFPATRSYHHSCSHASCLLLPALGDHSFNAREFISGDGLHWQQHGPHEHLHDAPALPV